MNKISDNDPMETQEWREALASVPGVEGPDRGHFLLDELFTQVRRQGTPVPYSGTAPYLNTIAPDRDPPPAGQPRDRAQDPLPDPLERARHRAARQQGVLRAGGTLRVVPRSVPAPSRPAGLIRSQDRTLPAGKI